MTFYQELQLNQAGSKAAIRGASSKKEKYRHIFIYLFKVFLNMVFCVSFVTACAVIFGGDNGVAGVVVLLCLLVFRFSDLGIHVSHSLASFGIIFAVLAFGPRLANMGNPVSSFFVHTVCILLLMVFGCHNVMMSNQFTLVLGYLLLFGYDVTGSAYLKRLALLAVGGILTCIIFYRNHRKKTYKRSLGDLLREFDLHSSRTKWQITLSLGVSSILLIAALLGVPRAMWTGIAAMSVILPFRIDLKSRVSGRIPGNIFGAVIFFLLYYFLPESLRPYIGILGGIGNGFSASYTCQVMFNSLGALNTAVGVLGLKSAIFYRIFNNVLGAVYALGFQKVCHLILDRIPTRQTIPE